MEPLMPVFNLEMQRLHFIPDLSCFRILNFPVLISLLVVNSGHADHPTMSPSPMLPVELRICHQQTIYASSKNILMSQFIRSHITLY